MSSIIELITPINAPLSVCFNLSRSVELHKHSTSHTNETVVSGRSSGLFEENDTVIWRAKHLGVFQQLEMQITVMQHPHFFEDCMLKGAFKSICHKHYFEQQNEITFMKDIFNYEVPYGIPGILFNSFYLKKYMTRLLVLRNQCIKDYAETGKWKTLPGM